MMQTLERTPSGSTVSQTQIERAQGMSATLRKAESAFPLCTMCLSSSAIVLLVVLLVCCPIAIMQGTMRWPVFHPSMAFTAPPEQYFAAALLPLSGALWFLYALAYYRGMKPYLEDLHARRASLSAFLLSATAFVSLVGVGAVPVLVNELVHDAFAKVCFTSTAIQCCLYAFLDSKIGNLVSICARTRRCLAMMMVLSALEVCVGIVVSRHYDLKGWFALVAGGEWVFLLCIIAFIVTSLPFAFFIDRSRSLYSPLILPFKSAGRSTEQGPDIVLLSGSARSVAVTTDSLSDARQCPSVTRAGGAANDDNVGA